MDECDCEEWQRRTAGSGSISLQEKKNITTSAATAAGRRLLAKVAVDRSEACGMRIGSHADSGPQLSKNLFTICAAGAALA